MNEQHEQEQLAAMVLADRADVGAPDLPALRAGGRRRLRRRRAALAVAGVAVLAAVAVPTYLASAGEDDQGRGLDPATSGTPSPTVRPTDPTDEAPEDVVPRFPERGELTIPDGKVAGEWEDGTRLGESLSLGRNGAYPEILYAAQRTVASADGGVETTTYVALGLVDGDRVLRLFSPIDASMLGDGDGLALQGGGTRDDLGPDPVYRLIGAVEGDHSVTVTAPDGPPRAVTSSSTRVLPGYTVFYDTGAFSADWDPLQLAPLTVDIDDGRSVEVRERSYES